MTSFETLRQLTGTVRQVYETAQALMAQEVQRADEERRQTLAQAERVRQHAEQALKTDQANIQFRQARAADLRGEIEAVRTAAENLLRQAGLAYLLDLPRNDADRIPPGDKSASS